MIQNLKISPTPQTWRTFFAIAILKSYFSELFSQKQFTVKSEHRERSIATRHSRQNNNSKLAPKQNSQFRLYPASAIHSELGRSCFVIKTNEKKNHAELQFSLVYTAWWYRLGMYQVHIRRLMGSTNQADPSCIYLSC